MSERENIVFMAKVAEQAERYSEMTEYMKEVSMKGVDLSVEERNLLSVAYKNQIGARRASWRVVSSILTKEEELGEIVRMNETKKYKASIEKELSTLCHDVIDLLSKYLIDNATSGESKGDYHRYMSEYMVNEDRETAANNALQAYKCSSDVALTELAPTHPVRLGLALNFSVFYYEILNSSESACQLAKQAFDDAIAELDTLSEDSYKDSTLIMQLLRDNLNLWQVEQEDDDKKDDGDN